MKPQGASFVWFTLIGAGGGGDTATSGGGSGAVTNCIVPAFLIPDSLTVAVGLGGASNVAGANSSIYYGWNTSSGAYLLLNANGGQSGAGSYAGGTASTSNYFSAMGFFQSVAGQSGSTGTQSASATTFLSGGAGGGNITTGNYGYTGNDVSVPGFFQMQPIIVGVAAGAGAGLYGSQNRNAIGCGGGEYDYGGNGLVVIITW